MTTPVSPSSAFPAHVPLLEFYVRPQEIQSCSWRVDQNGRRPTPRDCACSNLPQPSVCVEGYEAVKQQVNDATLENDPNAALGWCVHHVPPPHQHDATARQSWILGCFDGIRGVHKVL